MHIDSHTAAADFCDCVAPSVKGFEARGKPISSAREMIRRNLIHIFLISTEASALLDNISELGRERHCQRSTERLQACIPQNTSKAGSLGHLQSYKQQGCLDSIQRRSQDIVTHNETIHSICHLIDESRNIFDPRHQWYYIFRRYLTNGQSQRDEYVGDRHRIRVCGAENIILRHNLSGRRRHAHARE